MLRAAARPVNEEIDFMVKGGAVFAQSLLLDGRRLWIAASTSSPREDEDAREDGGRGLWVAASAVPPREDGGRGQWVAASTSSPREDGGCSRRRGMLAKTGDARFTANYIAARRGRRVLR